MRKVLLGLLLFGGVALGQETTGAVVVVSDTAAAASLASIEAAVTYQPDGAPFWKGFGVGLVFGGLWIYRRVVSAGANLDF
ncbi:MAG: hypothetical protein ACFUZC_07220 [Chthoniobacteraceae bacterium]